MQGRLTSANIGDSGFLVIGSSLRNRAPHVRYRSPQQEHSFGYPYQLGHQDTADHPHAAMLTNIPVRCPTCFTSIVCPSRPDGGPCHPRSERQCYNWYWAYVVLSSSSALL